MQTQWIVGFAAALSMAAAACQKDAEPAPQTETQSAKPATTSGSAAPGSATPGSATPGSAAPGSGTSAAVAPASAAQELKVGDDAPALTLTLQDGKTVSLQSLKGQQVVVYFYPKDDTPGCTVEAQGIRDQWVAFQKAGIQVFGVSMQDAASHTAFIEKHQLPFGLVVDADRSVAKAFGVPVTGGQFAARHTFLIGQDGKIKRVWREVTPKDHAKELLDAAGVSSAAAPATSKSG